MFPDLKQAGKKLVPNASTESRQVRKRMFPNARDGKFTKIFWEKSGSREMAFGNADL